MYSIVGLMPNIETTNMGGHGFCIKLYPEWKGIVAGYDITDEGLWMWCRETMGPSILKSVRLDFGEIRIRWGEWGLEHIDVPGNACGLDIADSIIAPLGGKALLPHNVDSMPQAFCILCVFTWFADAMLANQELNKMRK